MEKQESVPTAHEKSQLEMRKRHLRSMGPKSNQGKHHPGEETAIMILSTDRYKFHVTLTSAIVSMCLDALLARSFKCDKVASASRFPGVYDLEDEAEEGERKIAILITETIHQ
jgi:hypothetical protein